MTKIVESASASIRYSYALGWLKRLDPSKPALIVAPNLEAGSRILRKLVDQAEVGLFGWQRLTPQMLFNSLAERIFDDREATRAGTLTKQAVIARVVHDMAGLGRLGRYEFAAHRPGLPRALESTITELRMANVEPQDLPIWCADLAHIQRHYASALKEMKLEDDRGVIQAAVDHLKAEIRHPWCGSPILIFDVPVHSEIEAVFWNRFVGLSTSGLMTLVVGDERTHNLVKKHISPTIRRIRAKSTDAVNNVQEHLFTEVMAPLDPSSRQIKFLSSPGESREAIEMVRQIHRLADKGVPYDRIAVLTRSPTLYRSHLTSAFRRGKIPVWMAGGTRAPDPAGRAILALLACASEGLSARRFSEYASLGEMPDLEQSLREEPLMWEPPLEDDHRSSIERIQHDESKDSLPPFINPRRWEDALVDAAVIGGLGRWNRRLRAQQEHLRQQIRECNSENPERADALTLRLTELETMTGFVLPLMDALSALPEQAFWGEWLDSLGQLTQRYVRHPERVLALLADLQPLRNVGPVSLEEIRLVLAPRLSDLPALPAGRPEGRVWVSDILQARGMEFDYVLVPGLAERLFPEKMAEDPVLLDNNRKPIAAPLVQAADRVANERLRLRLAVGAASKGLILSYPRLDTQAGRPRVPSFYALEVLRAVEGQLPTFEALQRRTKRGDAPSIGWPAPANPAQAIDAGEFDLAMLRLAMDTHECRPGNLRFLLETSPFLSRSLRMRFMQQMRKWTPADGYVHPRAEAKTALSQHRLSMRSYSATALEKFTACPYRFFLHTILRVIPREVPTAIESIDPLQRGSLIHEVQYALLVALRDDGLLPLGSGNLEPALSRLDSMLSKIEKEYKERLAPSIDKVWSDGIALIQSDLREWLRQLASEHNWYPWRFELAFGLTKRQGCDPDFSTTDPAALDCGIQLRGAIDMVERRRELVIVGDAGTSLRATDTKTGRVAITDGSIIAGGKALQPVLYSLALEKLIPEAHVEGGRLAYSTSRGGFEVRDIPLSAQAREAAAELATVLEAYLERGFLPAAPRHGECTFCNYTMVCGSNREHQATKLKMPQDLFELNALRTRK